MSFPRYPEYKDTAVDWLQSVPAHWTVRRLGFHFTERREKVSDRDFAPLSVTKNGIVPQLETAAKTDDGDNRKKVCSGDFVINSRSDRKGSSGIAAQDGSVSLINIVLCPNHGVAPRFVHHLLRSVPFQEEFYRYGKGIVADLWSTNYSEMKNIVSAIPPLLEQQAIAEFLDHETSKIDALVSEQQRLIELLQEKRQAVISHAVTKGLNPDVPMKASGVEWLGDVPEHWEVISIRRIVAKIEQGWSPQCDSRPAEKNEWGILKTGCVNHGVFSEDENKALPADLEPIHEYEVKAGDVLMSRASGSPELVGATAYVHEVRPQLMLSDKTFRIHVTSRMHPQFFVAVFNSRPMRAQIEQSISGAEGLANNLPQSKLCCFLFALPPTEEQAGIVEELQARCGEFDSLISEAQRAIELLQERRTALISAAVTGKIDVRGLARKASA